MVTYVAEKTAPLVARIAELEAKPSVEYQGTWKRSQTYQRGHMVSDHGSVWCSLVNENRSRPGAGNTACWQLAVKHGRDGKDGKDASR
jgi:hypothetical protein